MIKSSGSELHMITAPLNMINAQISLQTVTDLRVRKKIIADRLGIPPMIPAGGAEKTFFHVKLLKLLIFVYTR